MQRPSKSALPPAGERFTVPPVGATRESREPSWLAVVLPQIALDALCFDRAPIAPADGDPASGAAAAVYELAGGQLRIVAVNEAGRRAGIERGDTVSAALSLIGTLALFERAASAEDAMLRAVAERVSRFTPKITLEPREGLLLEVGASLRLFGGLGNIRRMLAETLRGFVTESRISAAPTALAALWSARHGSTCVAVRQTLAGHLGELPLAVTGWPAAVQRRLREMGIRTVGDCLRLPRDGLARRAGQACLEDLDKALGRCPDPRPFYGSAGVVAWATDFAQETVDRQLIAAAVEVGVDSIAADLLRCQQQVRRLTVGLAYPGGGLETSSVEFIEPLHTARDLLAPLAVRLESIELAGPVTSISLETGPLEPLRLDAGVLFGNPDGTPVSARSRAVLIECLRGRFGKDGVYGLGLHDEHRPELAFRRLTESLNEGQGGTATASAAACARPLWLLPEPVRLSDDALRSMARTGPGPERIESGWWDGSDVQRDYYTVTTDAGERWWIYRDRITREWRLHGVFG